MPDEKNKYPEEIFDEKKQKKSQYYKYIINSISSNNFIINSKKNKINGNYVFLDYLNSNEKKVVEGPYFQYKLNEEGFRSKSFKEFNENNTNILFSGCSITQGVGLPEDLTWYKKLHNKISLYKNNSNIDFYNLGLTGSSIFLIYKNIITFLEKVGKPDYIFLLLPKTTRGLFYYEEDGLFLNANYFLNTNNKFDYSYKNQYVHENNLMLNFTILKSLEQLCESMGTKIIWATWENIEEEIYRDGIFKNFLSMSENLFKYSLIPEGSLEMKQRNIEFENKKFDNKEYNFMVQFMSRKNKNNEPYWHSAREGHPGSYFTEIVSEKFFNEFKKRKI